jgi:heme/copper-type cytochrome/quinol oxidase subunit 2
MKRSLVLALLLLFGCGASQQFLAIPPDIDTDKVPKQSVAMTAERFHFAPEVVHVRRGTLVTLRIKSIEGTHGFRLGVFGIDETIEENETKTVVFYASKQGEYGFQCSHFCGIGHLGMTGKVIVE